MIVRNEETNLEFCLESIKWCSEIVVVDMESTDRTTSIAAKYTDKIFSYPLTPAFDIARKYASERTTKKWILMIDADEMVTDSLRATIRNAIENDMGDVIYLPRENYIMGEWTKHTGWWPDYQMKLFKKGMVEFTGQLHSFYQVHPKARQLFLKPNRANALVHFNYRDSTHFIEKLNSYTSVEANHLVASGKKFSKFGMLKGTLGAFYTRFLRSGGYKDGFRGLALSVFMAFYRFLTYVKIWEAQEKNAKGGWQGYDDIKKRILVGFRESTTH